jgi:predicted site-specific integrase-resolvase
MIRRPPGYLTKDEAAERLGMSVKTLDRRMKTEPVLRRVMRKGQRVLLLESAVEAYFKLAQERGSI